MKFDLQCFGGRGGGSGRGGKSGKAGGGADLKRQASDYLNYHLGSGETDASVEKVTPIGKPDKEGYQEAKVEYSVRVRYSVGQDYETGIEQYETDTEYRSTTVRLKVK